MIFIIRKTSPTGPYGRGYCLEDNLVLFEVVNSRWVHRVTAPRPLPIGRWYILTVEISGPEVRGYLEGGPLSEYTAERPLRGYVGLWTKADSVIEFTDFSIVVGERNASSAPRPSCRDRTRP